MGCPYACYMENIRVTRSNKLMISLTRLMSTVRDYVLACMYIRSLARKYYRHQSSQRLSSQVWLRTARTINSITHCGRSLVDTSHGASTILRIRRPYLWGGAKSAGPGRCNLHLDSIPAGIPQGENLSIIRCPNVTR